MDGRVPAGLSSRSLTRLLGLPEATARRGARPKLPSSLSFPDPVVAPLLAIVLGLMVPVALATAATITFEVRPDGTPIQDIGGPNCGEIDFDTFRAWGVLFVPPPAEVLNVRNTLECLSAPNALALCSAVGILQISFVQPGTDVPALVDGIDVALFTGYQGIWWGGVNTYDGQGVLLDTWVLTRGGFCREPPFYYDNYHFSAPGRIARVECVMGHVGIDDVIVAEASTPVQGSTWGAIKSTFQ